MDKTGQKRARSYSKGGDQSYKPYVNSNGSPYSSIAMSGILPPPPPQKKAILIVWMDRLHQWANARVFMCISQYLKTKVFTATI